MKKILLVFLAISVLPYTASPKKTTYVYTDRRFNFIKREAADKDILKQRPLRHPYEITEVKMAEILRGIKINKRYVLTHEVETQEVFSTRAVNFLAPRFCKALREATPQEEIVFSYLDKRTKVILRNDYLTLGRIWVETDGLHIEFDKLLAKLFGDYDKRGEAKRVIGRAKGLHVALEAGPGQQFGQGVDELIVALQ